MNSPAIITAFLFIAISSTLGVSSYNSRTDNLDKLKSNTSVTAFIMYSEVLATFMRNNNTEGEINVSSLTSYYPKWLTARSDIKTFVVNGRGYVFMPDKKGMLNTLSEKTSDSKNIGITTATTLITPGATSSKPSFISEGYIVYVL